MTRTKLPNRRPNETVKIEHKGLTFFVTVGYDPETGSPMEVFGSTARSGSDFAALLNDACVAVSILLQSGVKPSEIAKSMHWSPVVGDSAKRQEPASVIGKIAELLVSMEKTA